MSGYCTGGGSSGANPFPLTYVPGQVLASSTLEPAVALLASIPPPSPLCGNNRLDPGEECDDGNRRDGDGCSQYCLREQGFCGDRVVESLLGEQCEPGTPSPVPCAANCRYLLTACGNDALDPGEACDDGTANSNAPGARCRPDCSPGRCGDHVLDPGEACDDGNRLSGDGCDAFCRSERGAGPAALPATVIDLPFTPSGGGSGGRGHLTHAPETTSSGPETLAVMLAGASAGVAWVRRRRG